MTETHGGEGARDGNDIRRGLFGRDSASQATEITAPPAPRASEPVATPPKKPAYNPNARLPKGSYVPRDPSRAVVYYQETPRVAPAPPQPPEAPRRMVNRRLVSRLISGLRTSYPETSEMIELVEGIFEPRPGLMAVFQTPNVKQRRGNPKRIGERFAGAHEGWNLGLIREASSRTVTREYGGPAGDFSGANTYEQTTHTPRLEGYLLDNGNVLTSRAYPDPERSCRVSTDPTYTSLDIASGAILRLLDARFPDGL